MKQKKRKLFSRVGAALLLGLSLFNFGAAWNKLRGGVMPKRARNIRKKTKEQVDSDMRQVADIAGEEAKVVLAAEQLEEDESQQQIGQKKMFFFQNFVRYAAVTVWAVSAGLVFTSVVFNYPFAMGKGLLSLLPGEPHVVSVSLMTQKDFFQVGDEIMVDIKINSNGEVIEKMKLTIGFDPKQLSFERFNFDNKFFDELLEQKIDQENGKIVLSFSNSQMSAIARGEIVGSLFFEGFEKTSECKVGIVQDESVVLKEKKGQSHNVLGKVSAASFGIVRERSPSVTCAKLSANQEKDSWEILAQGEILPQERRSWTEIGDDWSFNCGYENSEEIFVLVSGVDQDLNNVKFELGGRFDSSQRLKVEKSWKEDKRFFFGFVLKDLEVVDETVLSVEGIKFRISTENKSLFWPQKGSAIFVLEQ
ncbi:MAG: hypothetical protein U9O20_02365 [Patescibacteria group bacterium]|nr:hypothetical protein [Patescibacteria group bacterium]